MSKVEVVQNIYAAFGRDDIAAFLDKLADSGTNRQKLRPPARVVNPGGEGLAARITCPHSDSQSQSLLRSKTNSGKTGSPEIVSGLLRQRTSC